MAPPLIRRATETLIGIAIINNGNKRNRRHEYINTSQYEIRSNIKRAFLPPSPRSPPAVILIIYPCLSVTYVCVCVLFSVCKSHYVRNAGRERDATFCEIYRPNEGAIL